MKPYILWILRLPFKLLHIHFMGLMLAFIIHRSFKIYCTKYEKVVFCLILRNKKVCRH